MKKPTILFFGTPEFAAEILAYLARHSVPILGVVTQPDRPKGRSLVLAASPVKQVTRDALVEVPVFQPEKCSDAEFLTQIAALKADLYVVVAFGQILPQKLLDIPPLGCINVHASLLPKYRGAAPIHRALIDGESETGISIQKMVKQLDAGDVVAESKIAIPQNMNFGELHQALCDLAKPLLLQVIQKYTGGIPPAVAQDPEKVTFAAKITPDEGELKWERPALELHNLIRAFSPRPGAWCWVQIGAERKRLKIFSTEVLHQQNLPGSTLYNKELIIHCSRDALLIKEVQLEGKPRMPAQEWIRGLKTPPQFSCLLN